MTEADFSGMIAGRNEQFTRWALSPDNQALENFSRSFGYETQALIRLLSRDLPIHQPAFTVERRGVMGYLPPPERRRIASSAMRGESYVPQRVYHEEVSTGKKERTVDEAKFQLIARIDASTHLTDRYNSLFFTISSLYPLVGSSGYLIKAQEGGVDIRVRKIGGKLYVVNEGAMGNYDLKVLPLNTGQEINQAIAYCHSQLTNVLKFSPQAAPDFLPVVYEKIRSQLSQSLGISPGIINLPVLVGLRENQLGQEDIIFPAFHFSGPLAGHPFLSTGSFPSMKGFVPAVKPRWEDREDWEAINVVNIKNEADLEKVAAKNKAAQEGKVPQEEESAETEGKTEEFILGLEEDNQPGFGQGEEGVLNGG